MDTRYWKRDEPLLSHFWEYESQEIGARFGIKRHYEPIEDEL